MNAFKYRFEKASVCASLKETNDLYHLFLTRNKLFLVIFYTLIFFVEKILAQQLTRGQLSSNPLFHGRQK